MKFRTKFAALGCVGLIACVMTTTVHADDPVSKETQVTVNISSGGLVLTQPGKIDFGTIVMNGQKQTIDDATKSKLSLGDYRGTTKDGWEVTAKLQDEKFDGLGVTLAPSSDAKYVKLPGKRFALNDQAVEIVSVTPDKMPEEQINTDINLNTQLNVPDKISTGNHSNAIVWNIQDVPAS